MKHSEIEKMTCKVNGSNRMQLLSRIGDSIYLFSLQFLDINKTKLKNLDQLILMPIIAS